jgi:predicted transposase YdaD
LIETAVIYKLARFSREEIQTMLQVHDIRETRVYQEAMAEGKALGLKEGIALAIAKMAAKKMPAEEIATILEVDIDLLRQVLNSRTSG